MIGQQAVTRMKLQLQDLANGHSPQVVALDAIVKAMPLIIAADGVIVPFRPQPKTPKGKIVWQEVKVTLLTRLGKRQTKTDKTVTWLHQRRLVAVLGDINDLKPRFMLFNISGKLPLLIKMAILPEPLRCGLLECVINYVMVLVSASSKNWIG